MNPNGLRYFLAVARHGSFRRAGDALRVAASAINRQISLLEEELGAKLFERSRGRNRLQMTAAGEILLTHARAATNEIERARDQIEALKGLRGGTIQLGIAETFTRDFLPDFLAEFSQTMPRISFNITVATSPRLIELLTQDEIEIALAYNPAKQDEVHVAARLWQRTCMMMRADHPLAKKSSVRLSDYAQYPIVLPTENTSMRDLYDRVLPKLRVTPHVTLVTSSYEMLRSAARVGLGLAIVNEYLVSARDATAKDVVFVPIADPNIRPQELTCCVRAGRHLSVAATVFIERMREAFREFEAAHRKE